MEEKYVEHSVDGVITIDSKTKEVKVKINIDETKPIMEKLHLKTYLTVSSSIPLILYLLASYVTWDLTYVYDQILKIPEDSSVRMTFLSLVVINQVISFAASIAIKERKQEQS